MKGKVYNRECKSIGTFFGSQLLSNFRKQKFIPMMRPYLIEFPQRIGWSIQSERRELQLFGAHWIISVTFTKYIIQTFNTYKWEGGFHILNLGQEKRRGWGMTTPFCRYYWRLNIFLSKYIILAFLQTITIYILVNICIKYVKGLKSEGRQFSVKRETFWEWGILEK